MKKKQGRREDVQKVKWFRFHLSKRKKKGGDFCFEIGTLTTNMVAVVLVDGKECLLACCAKCC